MCYRNNKHCACKSVVHFSFVKWWKKKQKRSKNITISNVLFCNFDIFLDEY